MKMAAHQYTVHLFQGNNKKTEPAITVIKIRQNKRYRDRDRERERERVGRDVCINNNL